MTNRTEPRLRRPTLADGPAVHRLVADCPPLDCNSPYAYLLICRDFADSSIVAEAPDGTLAGVVTGYRPPRGTDTLFVWQVAVHPSWRGRGLAKRMVECILDRSCNRDVAWIEATVGPTNTASQALFAALASARDVEHEASPLFDERHLGPGHDEEWLHRVGPLVESGALQEA